jgi:hypothetical protein
MLILLQAQNKKLLDTMGLVILSLSKPLLLLAQHGNPQLLFSIKTVTLTSPMVLVDFHSLCQESQESLESLLPRVPILKIGNTLRNQPPALTLAKCIINEPVTHFGTLKDVRPTLLAILVA